MKYWRGMPTRTLKPGTVVIIYKPNVEAFHNQIGIVKEYLRAFKYDCFTPSGRSQKKKYYFSVALQEGSYVFPHDELKVL